VLNVGHLVFKCTELTNHHIPPQCYAPADCHGTLL
jgi:hypothetical protein